MDSIFCILFIEQEFGRIRPTGEGEQDMKGYTVESGYMGYVDGVYMLFASERDYRDYLEN